MERKPLGYGATLLRFKEYIQIDAEKRKMVGQLRCDGGFTCSHKADEI
jgi:hypothetical protein